MLNVQNASLLILSSFLMLSWSGKIAQSFFLQSLNEEQNVDSLGVQVKMGRKQFFLSLGDREKKPKTLNYLRVRKCSLLCLHVIRTSELNVGKWGGDVYH